MVKPWCQYFLKDKCVLNRMDNGTQCVDCMQALENKLLGVGDLVALTVNTTPLHRLKWKGCKCGKRQKWLNRLLPFVPKRFGYEPKPIKPIKRTDPKPCGCRKK